MRVSRYRDRSDAADNHFDAPHDGSHENIAEDPEQLQTGKISMSSISLDHLSVKRHEQSTRSRMCVIACVYSWTKLMHSSLGSSPNE
jgi:hypothetical protein